MTLKKEKNLKLIKAIFQICLFLLAIICFVKNCTNVNDTDAFYLIANGQYILKEGIPATNPFISTEGVPIVIQNWLYCVLVAFFYNWSGTNGLIIILGLQTLVAWLLTFYFLRKLKDKSLKILFTMLFFYVFSYNNIRPEIITYILCMLEIIGIEKYIQTNKRLWLLFLPLTVLLEINLHASYWIMHYIILLPYLMPIKFFDLSNSFKKNQLIWLILMIIVSIRCLIVNPYGTEAISYIFESLTGETFEIVSTISEQQSLRLYSIDSVIIILSVVIFVILIKNKKIDSVTFWMFLGFTFLGIYKIKFISFYAIGLLFLLRKLKDFELKINAIILSVLSLVMVLFISIYIPDIMPSEIFKNESLVKNSSYEKIEDVVNYLDKNETKDTSILAYFELGNFLEFKGYKTYYDARPEIYPIEMLKKVNIFYNVDKTTRQNRIRIQSFMDIDYAIVANDSITDLDLFLSSYYKLAFKGTKYSLYKKVK